MNSLMASAILLAAGCVAAGLQLDAPSVTFPARADSYLPKGVAVAPETVRGIRVGMNQSEVRRQLGNPHFRDGLFKVYEWNYVFKLPAAQGGLQECQFQLQFDAHNRVKASYWQTRACELVVNGPAPMPSRPVTVSAQMKNP